MKHEVNILKGDLYSAVYIDNYKIYEADFHYLDFLTDQMLGIAKDWDPSDTYDFDIHLEEDFDFGGNNFPDSWEEVEELKV